MRLNNHLDRSHQGAKQSRQGKNGKKTESIPPAAAEVSILGFLSFDFDVQKLAQ